MLYIVVVIVTDKQRSALDIKGIRDSYGLLAVTRMS